MRARKMENENCKRAVLRSDCDPECLLTLMKDSQGDIYASLNKTREADGDGEWRICMSGSHLPSTGKLRIMSLFEKLIEEMQGVKDERHFAGQAKNGVKYEEIKKTVGKNMRRLREGAGMTQQEIADKMGVTRCAVTLYETGRNNIPLHKAYEFADIMGVEINDILPERAAGTSE